MPSQLSNPSINRAEAQIKAKLIKEGTFFKFIQYKALNTIAINLDNAVATTGTWLPYNGNLRPAKATAQAPTETYSTNSSSYLGLLTSTAGHTSASAGASKLVVTNFSITNNKYSRISATTTVAGGTLQVQFYSDTVGVNQIGNFTAILPITGVTNYISFIATLGGVQAVVTNNQGQLGATTTLPITSLLNVRAIRYTLSSGVSFFEHQNANNSASLSGVLHTLALACFESLEHERELETAQKICENLTEGVTATSDSLKYTITVNSYSFKLLAQTWGTMVEQKTVNVAKKLGEFTTTAVTLSGVPTASANIGAGLDLVMVIVGDKTFGNRTYQVTDLEYDNFIYDDTTGDIYIHSENVGQTISISSNQNVFSNVYNMKALELGYLMTGQFAYLNESNEISIKKMPKAQIISATMNVEDSNNQLELEIQIYPDANKSFGQHILN